MVSSFQTSSTFRLAVMIVTCMCWTEATWRRTCATCSFLASVSPYRAAVAGDCCYICTRVAKTIKVGGPPFCFVFFCDMSLACTIASEKMVLAVAHTIGDVATNRHSSVWVFQGSEEGGKHSQHWPSCPGSSPLARHSKCVARQRQQSLGALHDQRSVHLLGRGLLWFRGWLANTSALGLCLVRTSSVTRNTQPVVTPMLRNHRWQFRWSWLFHATGFNMWWQRVWCDSNTVWILAGPREVMVWSNSQHWKHLGMCLTFVPSHVRDLIVGVMWQSALRDSALGFPRGALPEQVMGVFNHFMVIAMSTSHHPFVITSPRGSVICECVPLE